MSEDLSPAPEAPVSPDPVAAPAPAAPSEVPAAPLEGETPPVAPEPVAEPGAAPDGADSETASAGIDPAKYEFKFPDTFTPDEVFLTDARTKLADAGVPLEKAQGLIDLYVGAQTAAQTAANAEFEATNAKWLTELNALPDLQGPTRETSLAMIGRVFDEYGADAREAFTNPAIGNNPAVVKFMLGVAKALSEGTPSAAGRPAPTTKDGKPATRGFNLSYPNTPEITGT